jgi:hypothetical protein
MVAANKNLLKEVRRVAIKDELLAMRLRGRLVVARNRRFQTSEPQPPEVRRDGDDPERNPFAYWIDRISPEWRLAYPRILAYLITVVPYRLFTFSISTFSSSEMAFILALTSSPSLVALR